MFIILLFTTKPLRIMAGTTCTFQSYIAREQSKAKENKDNYVFELYMFHSAGFRYSKIFVYFPSVFHALRVE